MKHHQFDGAGCNQAAKQLSLDFSDLTVGRQIQLGVYTGLVCPCDTMVPVWSCLRLAVIRGTQRSARALTVSNRRVNVQTWLCSTLPPSAIEMANETGMSERKDLRNKKANTKMFHT